MLWYATGLNDPVPVSNVLVEHAKHQQTLSDFWMQQISQLFTSRHFGRGAAQSAD